MCELTSDKINAENMIELSKAMKTQLEGMITQVEGTLAKCKGNQLVSPASLSQIKSLKDNLEANRKNLNQILATNKPNLKFALAKLLGSSNFLKASDTLLAFIKKALVVKSF